MSLPLLLVSLKRLPRCDKPRASPPSGVHEGSVMVTLHCDAEEHILFTLDGSDPACPRARAAGCVQTYHGPFKLGVGSFKVTAIARCSDKVDSIPLTAVLIIKARCARPVFTPPPGFLGAPSTRTSPLPGADGAKAQKSDARMAPGRGAAQIALSTRTWDVKPGAKIHYSVYSVKLASEKVKEARHGVEEDGGHGPRREDQKETDETLLFQGFYSGPFSLPPATAGAGGECDEERSYLVRAIAMDASMLPSEQVSGVYTVPSTESRSLHQAAGGHDLAAPATRDRAEAMDNGVLSTGLSFRALMGVLMAALLAVIIGAILAVGTSRVAGSAKYMPPPTRKDQSGDGARPMPFTPDADRNPRPPPKTSSGPAEKTPDHRPGGRESETPSREPVSSSPSTDSGPHVGRKKGKKKKKSKKAAS